MVCQKCLRIACSHYTIKPARSPWFYWGYRGFSRRFGRVLGWGRSSWVWSHYIHNMISPSRPMTLPAWSYPYDINLPSSPSSTKDQTHPTKDLDFACHPEFSYGYRTISTKPTPPNSRMQLLHSGKTPYFLRLSSCKFFKNNSRMQLFAFWIAFWQNPKVSAGLRAIKSVFQIPECKKLHSGLHSGKTPCFLPLPQIELI